MSLAQSSLSELLQQLAAKTPSPGGGAVASIVGALCAALASMSVKYSQDAKGLADHAQAHSEALEELDRACSMMLAFAQEDAQAYASLSEAMGLPKDDPQRAALVSERGLAAMQVPLAVIATAVEMLRLCERLAPITSRHLKSDLHAAAIMTEAAARAARVMVEANVPLADQNDGSRLSTEADDLLQEAASRLASVVERCRSGNTPL